MKKLKKIIALIVLAGMFIPNVYAVTNSSVNLGIVNNSDGFQMTGGTSTARTIIFTGAAMTFNSTAEIIGANTYTRPASSDTYVGRSSTDTLQNKTITNSNDVLGAVTMTLGSDATADMYYRNSSGILTRLPLSTSNLLVGYDSTDVTPTSITIGTGLTYTHSTHTLSASSSGFSPMPTTVVTGTTQAMSVNNAYIANNASVGTYTLPSSASVGDEIIMGGLGAGGWIVAQNASQLIHFGNTVTTTGTGGSLASANAFDTVHLKCVVTNTTWVVIGSQGNITVA